MLANQGIDTLIVVPRSDNVRGKDGSVVLHKELIVVH